MFENVQFFSHVHLKYAKSAIMTKKKLSVKISIWVLKKRRIFMLISKQKDYSNFEYFLFLCIFSWFSALNFYSGHF
jgi:hypothetical protein